jgi:hypothetical protein
MKYLGIFDISMQSSTSHAASAYSADSYFIVPICSPATDPTYQALNTNDIDSIDGDKNLDKDSGGKVFREG